MSCLGSGCHSVVGDACVTWSKIYYYTNKQTKRYAHNILPQIKLTYPFSDLIIFAYFLCIYDPNMCLALVITYIHSALPKYIMCAIRYYK